MGESISILTCIAQWATRHLFCYMPESLVQEPFVKSLELETFLRTEEWELVVEVDGKYY